MKRKPKTNHVHQDKETGLTKRQRRFVDEYLVDFNGTQAAIRAGYGKLGAHVAANRLLNLRKVAEKIEQMRKDSGSKTVATRERVIQELCAIAFGDTRKLFDQEGNLIPVHKLDEETAASISSLEVDEINLEGKAIGATKKIKRWEKTKALELLGRHLGMWDDPPKPPTVGPGLVVQIIGGQTVNDGNNRVVSYVPVSLPGPEKET